MCQSDLQDLSAHQQWAASMNEIFIRDPTDNSQNRYWDEMTEAQRGNSIINCRVPDEYLVHTRRPLLMGREVLKATLAHWSEIREC